MEKWIHPKTKTGDAVVGESFLRRKKINDLFWSHIVKGSDVLFVAPRRVGKTSIMKDLIATAPENYYCVYRDVEGATTKNLFYKRLFEMLIERLGKAKKNAKLFTSWISRYDIKKVGTDGIEIGRNPKDFQKEVNELLEEVAKEGLTIIFFIDEFVEVILNLRNSKKIDDAISILHELREIRHNDVFKNIIFVFAGSIGLHNIVKEIGRPKLINDIEPFHIGPLTESEANQLINQLTEGATIQYNQEIRNYLFQRIEYLLPYFVQLIIAEIDLISYQKEKTEINQATVDEAFNNVVKNTSNFDDWILRLKDYLRDNFNFINHVLKCCAFKENVTIQEIYNISAGYKKEDVCKDLMDNLVRDGYLREENGNYQFLSPFIKIYWQSKNPLFKC